MRLADRPRPIRGGKRAKAVRRPTVALLLDGRFERVREVRISVDDKLGEQSVAIGEVAIQRWPSESHLAGDGVERQRTRAGLGELLQGEGLGLGASLGAEPLAAL